MSKHKFVIWGAGRFGLLNISLLGKERIVGFIDSDKTLYGTELENIPIFSYETYKKEYKDFPIIITPKKFAKEIQEKLNLDGIYHCFNFNEEMMDLEGFLFQAPKKLLFSRIKEKSLMLSDFNALSILLYDYFTQKGLSCFLRLEGISNPILVEYIKNVLNINVKSQKEISKNDGIILTIKNTNCDISCNTNYNYSQLGLQKDLYNFEELKQFKDIHKDKRCFIIGCGPSLKMQDLDTLHANNEICFSCNGIIKAFNQTQWRPDYYCLSDPLAFLMFKEQILLENDIKASFLWDNAGRILSKNNKTFVVHGIKDNNAKENGELPQFSSDITKGTYWGGSIIYDIVLQLAVYMGFTEIYLLGCDCSFTSNETRHFVKDYDTTRTASSAGFDMDFLFSAYQVAKQYADAHGIKIYNATRGGALEVFVRVNFDTLF